MPVAFDTHALITKLIHGQMPQVQAEAVSAALTEALDDVIGTLATKKDLEALGTDLRKDLGALGTDLRKDLGALGTDLRTEMAAMDTRIAHEFKHLRWMIGVNMTLTLIILGKLLFFKP